MQPDGEKIREALDSLYRSDSRKILATLIRLLGDFDLAEEAMHVAFAAAMDQWPREGLPANPKAWLVSTGRFKGIDSIRRNSRWTLSESSADYPSETIDPSEEADKSVKDDELRLIFTCCHPALSPDARVALTLREVCGLTTEEIARAYLCPPPTIAQRIVRAKAKIRGTRIPYRVPTERELPERLETVLQVIYLVFNEGYSASAGDSLTRADLSGEAIRLGRVLMDLLPEPEVTGLLALMTLQESRRAARTTTTGEIVLLEHQDRSRWNRDLIEEGMQLVAQALASRQVGSYTLQAAIASVHARARRASETDWKEIVGWYDLLMKAAPSPVVELNRAVAVAMSDGPLPGIELIDEILARGELSEYHLVHSARADLCRRLGRTEEARTSYRKALQLVKQEPEKRFLEGRLAELSR